MKETDARKKAYEREGRDEVGQVNETLVVVVGKQAGERTIDMLSEIEIPQLAAQDLFTPLSHKQKHRLPYYSLGLISV